MKKQLLAAFALSALASGCSVGVSQPAQEQVTFRQVVAADLNAAIAQAKVDNDTVALQCWTAIRDNIGTADKQPLAVEGVASAIQAKRSLKGKLATGLPKEVVTACSGLYVEEHFAVMGDLTRFLGLVR